MTVFSHLRRSTMAILGVTVLLGSCGKKVKEEGSEVEKVPLPISTIEEFLSKQNISCEKGLACPTYLAKVVSVVGKDYRFCTGFLISPTVLATTSSCLPDILRKAGQDCSRDLHFFFPKQGSIPAVQASCEKVLQASELDGSDPVLWRDDLALLELKEPIHDRRKATISRSGPTAGRSFVSWSVDQQDEHSAIIKRNICEPVYNSYLNPLSVSENSPNLIFSDCGTAKSSIGSPVLDSTGRVRAISSRTVDEKVVKYLHSTGLLVNGLKLMSHGTNFACASVLSDTEMGDERECLKELSYVKVDKLRGDMLATTPLFKEQRLRYEQSLQNLSKHFYFGIKTASRGDVQDTAVYPLCFKPLKEWLYKYGSKNTFVEELTIPNVSFRRVMDPYGKIQGITVERAPHKVHFQFSLKNLRSTGRSYVLSWGDSTELETFQNVSEVCSPRSISVPD